MIAADAESIAQTAPALIPSHGNGQLRPWQPGQSGNPSGTSKAVRDAAALAKQAAPDAMRMLIALMNNPTEDSRARIVAALALLDRALGKPKDAPPEDAPDPIDLSDGSARREVMARLDRMRALLAEVDARDG